MKIAAISIADYCEATAGMPHDVERLYFRMILKMYSREDGLPDNDADNARIFGYDDVRTYKHAKKRLLAWPGTVKIVGGKLVNERALEEIKKVKDRKKAAADRREIGGRSTGDRREIGGRSHMQQDGKSTTYDNPSPSPSPTPEEENIRSTITPRAMDDRPPDGYSDLKSAFNGSTEAMLADVQRFMGPLADRQNAINWLTGTLTRYGEERTVEAWTIVTAAAGKGRAVANPLAFWAKTAGGITPKPKKPDRSNMVFKPSRFGPGRWVPKEAVQ